MQKRVNVGDDDEVRAKLNLTVDPELLAEAASLREAATKVAEKTKMYRCLCGNVKSVRPCLTIEEFYE